MYSPNLTLKVLFVTYTWYKLQFVPLVTSCDYMLTTECLRIGGETLYGAML